MIELLAPAGTSEAFRSAISAGADAVYLGGNRFGARHFAGNFDDVAMSEAVTYAHLRGVKVYVTVNTLIHDSELQELVHYLLFLAEIGVDAIIIQDMAVLTIAGDLFSDIPHAPSLHASTQMALHNREGALYAIEHRCSRVVLARELTAKEVRTIAVTLSDCGGEIEIFGHGALCYAYSGQCLLSAVIGGRSGNRGMCAQPCRKPYDLYKGIVDTYGRMFKGVLTNISDQYVLSTRDLSVYPTLNTILSLPITSLKIEGRMRSAEYVATVTRIYRRALNANASPEGFVPSSDEETDLTLAFSRGFTTGYVNEEDYQTVMGRDLPGRRGIFVGIVAGVDKNGMMIVDPAGDLIPERGDGLVCISHHDEQGFILRYEPIIRGPQLIFEIGIPFHRGDQIYLTSSGRSRRSYEDLMQDPDHLYLGSIILHIAIDITPEGIVAISGTAHLKSSEQISFSFRSSETLSPARSRPLTAEVITSSIQKTGGTLFIIKSLQISCPEGLFAPVSLLNGIRREILDYTSQKIIEATRISADDVTTVRNRAHTLIEKIKNYDSNLISKHDSFSLIVIVSDLSSAINACESGAERAYIEWYPNLERDEAGIVSDIQSKLQNSAFAEKIGIKLPRILRQKDLDTTFMLLPELITAGINNVMVDGLGVAEALRNRYPDLTISGYSGLNITNHIALSCHQELEFCTLSCELSGPEMRETMWYATNAGIQKPLAVIVQGLIEAVITEDHPGDLTPDRHTSNDVFGLKDQKGQIFPFVTDPHGRTHIFNAAETSLLDRIDEIKNSGIRYGILDARWRGPVYSRDMTTLWMKAIDIKQDPDERKRCESLKEEARKYTWGGLTSATWKRGLCEQFQKTS